ncbi:MAG: LAGLIDADG family homing endonuclease [Candidatus Micrarchaeota archaeon]
MFYLDNRMAEFCGVISGDGNIWSNGRKYEITITGSPKNRQYLDKIAEYVAGNIKPKAYYRVRGRGLRLTIYSKEFFRFLIEDIGLGRGLQKNKEGIPPTILEMRDFRRAFIRGLFDTDGSVFTSKKKGSPNYPTIEITNANLKLLLDVRLVLEEEGFRTTFRSSNTETYKIAVHGEAMLDRWTALIGSSNPEKSSRMESIINAFSRKE